MKDHSTANALLLILVVEGISCIWSLAEAAEFGAPQPSDSDTLVCILFVATIIAAYYRGVAHGKEIENSAIDDHSEKP